MRLDLFLKVSRLIARRSLAQEFCDAGQIKVNDQTAKSAKEVKTGDRIEIRRGKFLRKLQILSIPAKKQIAKSDAEKLYEMISEETLPDEIFG